MKKKLLITLSFFLVLILICSCSAENNDAQQKNETEVTDSNETVYETSEQCVEAFLEICKKGDTDKMYAIYYDDLLTKTLEDSQSGIDKDTFNSLLKQEMMSINQYEVYRYGDIELMDTVPPFYYVNYHYGMIYGKDIPIENGESVTDCTVLRTYKNDGSYGDHVFIEIDGHWFAAI